MFQFVLTPIRFISLLSLLAPSSLIRYDQGNWPLLSNDSTVARAGNQKIRNPLDAYQIALESHQPAMVNERDISELIGRLMRGNCSEDFRTLHYNQQRRLVTAMGPDGLHRLLHETGYQMLVELGWSAEVRVF